MFKHVSVSGFTVCPGAGWSPWRCSTASCCWEHRVSLWKRPTWRRSCSTRRRLPSPAASTPELIARSWSTRHLRKVSTRSSPLYHFNFVLFYSFFFLTDGRFCAQLTADKSSLHQTVLCWSCFKSLIFVDKVISGRHNSLVELWKCGFQRYGTQPSALYEVEILSKKSEASKIFWKKDKVLQGLDLILFPVQIYLMYFISKLLKLIICS